MPEKTLTPDEQTALLQVLQKRFEKHPHRHKGIVWSQVRERLEQHPDKLIVLDRMEETGGEPDVIGMNSETGALLFCDCAAESPKGRRSLCYDREALESRKDFPPVNNVLDVAAELGIELLNEAQYRALQQLDAFDLKTSSWIRTPDAIRQLGGALFCDRRYDHVFTYHNGAQSYYAARGFRGMLSV